MRRSDALRLILSQFSTLFCGFSKAERVGAIYLAVIGTAFTTSSENGAHSVYLTACSKSSTQTATLLEMDSTFCKVHQSACSGRKDQAIGSSRGGKNSKVHVLINDRMQLLNVILTGGQIHDSQPAISLLKAIKLKGKKILADKAYSSAQIRIFLAEHGALACIPDKANFRVKHDFDSQLYKQRKKSRAVFSANPELPSYCHALR